MRSFFFFDLASPIAITGIYGGSYFETPMVPMFFDRSGPHHPCDVRKWEGAARDNVPIRVAGRPACHPTKGYRRAHKHWRHGTR